MVNLLRKNRLAALLLCLLFSCSFIASCENVSLPESTEDSASESSEATSDTSSSIDAESPLQYVGGEFTIAITEDQKNAFGTDPNTDDIIGLGSLSRNEQLAEKCGIELKLKVVSADNVMAEMEEAKKAGTSYADILCLPAETLASLADGGYLYNLLASQNLKVDSNFLNTTAAKSMAGNNTLYMLFDSATQFYDESWVVFYDKQLVSGTGLPDPAVLAASGQWTWEEFLKYSEAVAQKVMSKGSPDVATDVFGYASYNSDTELPLTIWESCGIKLFGDTYGSTVSFRRTLSELNEYAGTLQSVYLNKSRLSLQGDEAVKAFKNGRLGFFIYKLGFSSSLAQSGRDWSILPLPKYSAQQSNYNSYIDPNAYAFAVPANVANPQKSILALNMICAASKDTMRKAVYDKYVNLYFTNNTSTIMLNTIMDSAYFDFAAIHASGMPKIADISTKIIIDFVTKKGSKYTFTTDTKTLFERYVAEKFK